MENSVPSKVTTCWRSPCPDLGAYTDQELFCGQSAPDELRYVVWDFPLRKMAHVRKHNSPITPREPKFLAFGRSGEIDGVGESAAEKNGDFNLRHGSPRLGVESRLLPDVSGCARGVPVTVAVVGEDEWDELGIVPSKFCARQFLGREFPLRRPDGPKRFAEGDGIGLESLAAAIGIEIPLIPVGADLRWRLAPTLKHEVRGR